MMKVSRIFNYLLLLGLAFLSWQCSSSEGKEKQKVKGSTNNVRIPTYNTVTVNTEDIDREILITGRVLPLQKIDVISEVQGTALDTKHPFEEGMTFKKGEVLIAIDDREFRYNLSSQRSKYLNALVRVMSDLKIDYPEHFPTWEKYLSKIDVDAALPKLPEVKDEQLRYFMAANNIFDLYYAIRSQEEKLKDYTIEAPFSGAITMASVDPGDLIRPGVKLGELIRTDVYEVIAAVSITDLDQLSEGQQIDLHARSINEKFTAALNRIGKSVDQSTQSVSVYFRVPGGGLKEGMYLEGSFTSTTFNAASEIPKHILTRENQVYAIQDSTINLKTVQPLQYRQQTVIVKGLDDGDKLITDPIYQPIQGTRGISK